MFDGETFDAEHDLSRLGRQLDRVKAALERAKGKWLTLAEISERTKDPQASISARIRDLRKEKFGGYEVERRRRGDPKLGLWEYRIKPEAKETPLLEEEKPVAYDGPREQMSLF